ncbi:MAG: hypothetical protein U0270_33525 [Labilithrix sp.]
MSDLTTDEQKHVRAALNFLKNRFGWPSLAKILHYNEWNIRKLGRGAKTISPTMAFRVARLAQVGVDDILTGKWPAPGTCPHCGHHDAAKAAK